jgi:hypothetical protein
MSDLDAAWAELLLDACASDGPIRDADVKTAIARYRPKIEALATAETGLRDAALALVSDAWYREGEEICTLPTRNLIRLRAALSRQAEKETA